MAIVRRTNKKRGRPKRTATLISGNCLSCLPLEEARCNAKRAERCSEQHHRCSALRQLAARRSKRGSMRGVLANTSEFRSSHKDRSAHIPRLLMLQIRERAFCFGCQGLVKAGDQGLIKDSLRFSFLPGLELRHSQIKKRIGIERPFPGAFL
jgi:hypothetical protein